MTSNVKRDQVIRVNDLGLCSYWCCNCGCCWPSPPPAAVIWYCWVRDCLSVPYDLGFHSLFPTFGLYIDVTYDVDENESAVVFAGVSCAISWWW